LTKHPDEELVEAMVEAFEADVQLVVEFLTTEGRPIFTRPLTAEEQYRYFSNPATRQLMLQRVQQRDGPAGVRRYLDSMMRIGPKLEAERQAKLRAQEGAGDAE
jgi:hypothetical protein